MRKRIVAAVNRMTSVVALVMHLVIKALADG